MRKPKLPPVCVVDLKLWLADGELRVNTPQVMKYQDL